jgi:hypothetical protein
MLLNTPISLNVPDWLYNEVRCLKLNKEFEQEQIHTFSKDFQNNFQKLLENISGHTIEIISGWMNCTKYTGKDNDFGWHNESDLRSEPELIGEYVCTLWLAGAVGQGGAYKFIDDDGNVIKVELNPPSLIFVSKHTLHSVESYLGTEYRISFNLNFNIL